MIDFPGGVLALEPVGQYLKKGIFLPKLCFLERGSGRAMLPKWLCFLLAGLLVMVPLWILMSYGITAEGRPSSPKILIGMTFCFVVGVFWLYKDMKELLRTR